MAYNQAYPDNKQNTYGGYTNPNFSAQQTSNSPPPYTLPQPVKADPVNLNTMENGNFPNNNNNNGGWGDMNGLSDKMVRIKFIRKVYLIVTSQLIFTFGICTIFVFVEPVKTFAKSSSGLIVYIISYVLFVTLIITFSICQCFKGLRKVPYNYMLLGAITLSMTYMLGMISAYHDIQAVFIAIGITLLITIGVTLFAMQTKFDFTQSCWLIAICLSFALLGFGIACAISFRYIPILQAVYGGLGACLMAIFLAIDTQLLVGNKRFKYHPEDYVNAALQIYLDICYLFLYILQIVGAGKK